VARTLSAAPAPDGVWSAEDTTPGDIDAALRRLLEDRGRESRGWSPARVINLVVVIDADRRTEILGRLELVGRFHPSRTILCVVSEERERLDAWATMACDVPSEPGALSVCQERVEIDVGPRHLPHLDSVVRPLLVTDLDTLVWAPHGHPEALDALLPVAEAVLHDSSDGRELRPALERLATLTRSVEVVDLAWLRTKPWRERIAATYDPPARRAELNELARVIVRHDPGPPAPGLLLLGWLAARLGWESSELTATGEASSGSARAADGAEVALRLEPDPAQSAPGLGGVTLETRSGVRLSLDRGPGGLQVVRSAPDTEASKWTALGASRGEAGVLGSGIREALLRQTLFEPALEHARAMLA
jgi:glucose-6-phosphate dehydrogenase assembly protein OpcA